MLAKTYQTLLNASYTNGLTRSGFPAPLFVISLRNSDLKSGKKPKLKKQTVHNVTP